MRIRWRDFELPSGVTLAAENEDKTYGRFHVEPFERGFGHTIGNGLRRVLLSSIEGTAVTALLIEGVEHEFKSIEGILEDVTEIVLNVKALRFQVDGETPVEITVDVTGPAEVTGKDLQCPTGVKVVNEVQRICTITKEGVRFQATLRVRRGRGYVAAEETGEPVDEIGLIPLDAAFSPVMRVRHSVEATRVGKFTNYDRLVLEVWTDGTVEPQMALVEAAKIFRKHLNPFVQFSEPKHGVPVVDEVRPVDAALERRREKIGALLNESIERLDLSTRARNCLDVAGIATLGDLVFKTKEDLLAIKNLGQTVLTEIEKKLAELDLSIGMDREEILGSASS